MNFRRTGSLMLILILLFSLNAVPAHAGSLLEGQPRSRIFLGDSRTVGMYATLYGKYSSSIDSQVGSEYWVAREGQGYRYMTGTAVPKAEAYGIDWTTDIYFLFGVNDLSNQAKYAEYISSKAAEWRWKGAHVYFVSVNPVYEGKCRSISNAAIEQFNAAMKQDLPYYVTYIDTYSNLVGSISTEPSLTDSYGLHYKADTYRTIYRTLVGS